MTLLSRIEQAHRRQPCVRQRPSHNPVHGQSCARSVVNAVTAADRPDDPDDLLQVQFSDEVVDVQS